ncbi:MAG TPA: lipoyl(octanoyl) transferase LipB [Bryobacteraceae bacterium]|nr:lipoyl(octanoyl) transferase LipB [Bryobacteraceae bacterium]
MSKLEVRQLGRMNYTEALEVQRKFVDQRKQGLIPNQLLFVEHPHVITMGRNGHLENLLADRNILERTGISFHETNRGGDVTYHGPGQIVGYPIFDLREWKRDVVAYIRSIEQVVIDTLAEFAIPAERDPQATGAWVGGAKVCAIGVHISRWVTSHGFALNLDTDLQYFQYIVPCGLTRPVSSMRALGCKASRAEVEHTLARHFAAIFGLEVDWRYSNQFLEALPAQLTERVT